MRLMRTRASLICSSVSWSSSLRAEEWTGRLSRPLKRLSRSSKRFLSSAFSFSRLSILESWSLMMAGMSEMLVDMAFCLGARRMRAHAEAKRSASTDSSRFDLRLCRARRMWSTLLPPREAWSRRVSLDSRKGMWEGRFALARQSTTRLRQRRERLIMMPSLARVEPTALPVFTRPSDPARSRRLRRAWRRPRPTTIQLRSRMSNACERDDVAFMPVDSVARAWEPFR
mmetsp:Transcript_12636/g.38005  ORF Transcript_12636/g.38005 Transcript_12636/m.38005 type:complete len:228 (+) Transcript_12636:138-821(+)